MDTKLLEASRTGNVETLHQLLVENPLILDKIALLSTENPLHIASMAAGCVNFVQEIAGLKPEFSKEINQDGFSPLHMAAACGHVWIVEVLVNVDPGLCRLKGKEKTTPLHCAATKGRAEVLSLMLYACPDSIEDITVQKETALHLAVKNNQFDAVEVLLDWIREKDKLDILNMKDELGNTVLHLATWKKQRQIIESFLGNGAINAGFLEVNARNDTGLTALDLISIFPSEAGDREIADTLQAAGGTRAEDITISPSSLSQSVDQTCISIPTRPVALQTSQANNLLEYFKFRKGRDSPSEARGTLLVIAVLVATATFQVGLSPPGGIWQDTYEGNQNINSTEQVVKKAHYAGQSIMATSGPIWYCTILFFNSIGFSASLSMINILTCRFPLQFELKICIIAMCFTYNTTLIAISSQVRLYVGLTTTILAIVTPMAGKFLRLNAKRLIRAHSGHGS